MECVEEQDLSQNINKKIGGRSECPECRRHGLSNRLRLFQIGWGEAVQLCENDKCLYPMMSDPATLLTNRQATDIGTKKKRWKKQISRRKDSTHSDISFTTSAEAAPLLNESYSRPESVTRMETSGNFTTDQMDPPVLDKELDFLFDGSIPSEASCDFKDSEITELVAMLDGYASGNVPEPASLPEPASENIKRVFATIDPIKINESVDGVASFPTYLSSVCSTLTPKNNAVGHKTMCETLKNRCSLNFSPITMPGTLNELPIVQLIKGQASNLTLQRQSASRDVINVNEPAQNISLCQLKTAASQLALQDTDLPKTGALNKTNNNCLNGLMLEVNKKTDFHFASGFVESQSESSKKIGQQPKRSRSRKQDALQSKPAEILEESKTRGELDIFSCLDRRPVRTALVKKNPKKKILRSSEAVIQEIKSSSHSRVSSWLEKEQTTTKRFSGYQSKTQKTVVKDVGSVSDDSGIQSPLSGRSEESSGSRPIR